MKHRSTRSGAFYSMLFLAVSGCSAEPTQVIVEVDADTMVRELTRSVSLEIGAREAGTTEFTPLWLGSTLAADWPLRHVLTPADGDASREYIVVATALDASGQPAVRQQVASGYVDGETRVLRIFFGASCLRVQCEEAETCANGTCVDRRFITPDNLPRVGAPVTDAGVDAPVADAQAPLCDGEGDECTPDSNPCLFGHIVCIDGAPECAPNEGGSFRVGAVCNPRDESNECDADDTCDAEGLCVEQLADDGVMCGATAQNLLCSGGVCSRCGGPCPILESCAAGVLDCSGATPACTATVEARQDGSLCRRAAGRCDAAERCDGVSLECPPDSFEAVGTECRAPSLLGCDAVDICLGDGPRCPNRVEDNGTTCRPSRDGSRCDPEEKCDGTLAVCPADVFDNVMTECRPSVSDCDTAEYCQVDDVSATCPADTGIGTTCLIDDTTSGLCLADGSCVENVCGQSCPPVAGAECYAAQWDCSSGSPVCTVTTTPLGNQTECGDSSTSDACDAVNHCDGAGGCVEENAPNGTLCSGTESGPCLDNYSCAAGSCVPNFKSGGTLCDESTTACTLDALCNGSSPSCPAQAPAPSGTPCDTGNNSECSVLQCDGDFVCANTIEPGSACSAPICHAGMCSSSDSCEIVAISGGACPGGTCMTGTCVQEALISEVGSSGTHQFVEFFNPSGNVISLGGCVLEITTNTSTVAYPFPSTSNVSASGFFLVGDLPSADFSMFLGLDPSEGSAVLSCDGVLSDGVGWGGTTGQGTSTRPFMTGSIERKACSESTAANMRGTHESFGNSYDVNDNDMEFVWQSAADPQHSTSPAETAVCPSM